jgi:hypothetical protein
MGSGAGAGARSHVDTGRSRNIGAATRHDRLGGSWLGFHSDRRRQTAIALARERMLICRPYIGLLQTITDDYGADFAAHSDSLASSHQHLHISAHGDVLAGSRKPDSACASAAAHGGSEASARPGEGRLCGRVGSPIAAIASVPIQIVNSRIANASGIMTRPSIAPKDSIALPLPARGSAGEVVG